MIERYKNPREVGGANFSFQFVGRISLSAESLGKPFTIGRYGYLPYVGVCGDSQVPTRRAAVKLAHAVAAMSLSSLGCWARNVLMMPSST